jgi:hypothetical protein
MARHMSRKDDEEWFQNGVLFAVAVLFASGVKIKNERVRAFLQEVLVRNTTVSTPPSNKA